jgi:hypothetical protein
MMGSNAHKYILIWMLSRGQYNSFYTDSLLRVPLDLYRTLSLTHIPCQRPGKEKTYGYTVTSSVPTLPVCTDVIGRDENSTAENLVLIPLVSTFSLRFAAVRIMIRLNAMPITFVFYQSQQPYQRHSFSIYVQMRSLREDSPLFRAYGRRNCYGRTSRQSVQCLLLSTEHQIQ